MVRLPTSIVCGPGKSQPMWSILARFYRKLSLMMIYKHDCVILEHGRTYPCSATTSDNHIHSSHENRFLIAGLKIKKLPDWAARQAAYLAAVKEFLVKLKPEFSSLPILFVRAIRYEPKLLLSVECAKAKQ